MKPRQVQIFSAKTSSVLSSPFINTLTVRNLLKEFMTSADNLVSPSGLCGVQEKSLASVRSNEGVRGIAPGMSSTTFGPPDPANPTLEMVASKRDPGTSSQNPEQN